MVGTGHRAHHAPLLGLFSVVTLMADVLIGQQQIEMTPRTTAWYEKTSPSFADAIAMVRRYIWVRHGTFTTPEPEPELIKVPSSLYHLMLDSLAYAAWPESTEGARSWWQGGE